jgi:hypothetical protein
MKIRVFSKHDYYTMTTLFDIYYAYKQYQCRNHNYQPDLDIKFLPMSYFHQSSETDVVNIGWYHMPDSTDEISCDKFDLILFDNDHHHLEVCTQAIYNSINHNNNCYLVFGCYLPDNHAYKNKIIWHPQQFVDRDYYTRPMYPQYFEKQHNRNPNKNKKIIYINGHNRAHRQYFLDILNKHNLNNLKIKNSITSSVSETKECFFESKEDSEFRDHVMAVYPNAKRNEPDSVYYKNKISMGIDAKYGEKPPGYVFIDEYFEYSCVIFPESTWINNEILITEKIVKCFVAKTLPWPIGGANIHHLYNQLGFKTVYNLLPPEHQQFDRETDHVKRIDLCVRAIEWMTENMHVLETDLAKSIVNHNYELYHTSMLDLFGAQKLDDIINKVINERRH